MFAFCDFYRLLNPVRLTLVRVYILLFMGSMVLTHSLYVLLSSALWLCSLQTHFSTSFHWMPFVWCEREVAAHQRCRQPQRPAATHIALSMSCRCRAPSVLASRKRPLTARVALACDELSWTMAREREDRAAELWRNIVGFSWGNAPQHFLQLCHFTAMQTHSSLFVSAQTMSYGTFWIMEIRLSGSFTVQINVRMNGESFRRRGAGISTWKCLFLSNSLLTPKLL